MERNKTKICPHCSALLSVGCTACNNCKSFQVSSWFDPTKYTKTLIFTLIIVIIGVIFHATNMMNADFNSFHHEISTEFISVKQNAINNKYQSTRFEQTLLTFNVINNTDERWLSIYDEIVNMSHNKVIYSSQAADNKWFVNPGESKLITIPVNFVSNTTSWKMDIKDLQSTKKTLW